MNVSLQGLKVFEAAARLGSFKLAAQELALTPTAISHHINNLESRLEVDLFHRKTRQIKLTEAGSRLASATSESFRKIDQALAEVRASADVVRVNTTSSLAAHLLIPSLRAFSDKYADIEVEILTGESLENRLYDLPIRLGATANVESYDVLCDEHYDVFGTADCFSSIRAGNPITLYTTRWKNASLPAPPFNQWIEKNLWEYSPSDIKTFDQELFGISEALKGSGLVFCSTTLTRILVNEGLLQTSGTTPVKSELCYYVPDKNSYTSRNSQRFLTWFSQLLPNH